MTGFYVQDPDEIVYVSVEDVPDRRRGLTESAAQAMVFETEAQALEWRDRLDPFLGPLVVVPKKGESG